MFSNICCALYHLFVCDDNKKIARVIAGDVLCKMRLDGASPNLFGSVIAMQAWLQHSPFEVVFASRQDDI